MSKWHLLVGTASSSEGLPLCSISSVSYSSAPAKNTGRYLIWLFMHMMVSPEMYPMTDGWDIYRSSYVTIADCAINNGDDCVCTCLLALFTWKQFPYSNYQPSSRTVQTWS